MEGEHERVDTAGDEETGSYTREVGERLRSVRVERGWSLQEVERLSVGRWKAAVVGSYERGDRNITATRLLELAAFYGVSPADVLPGDLPTRPTSSASSVAVDLERLEHGGPRFAALRRYLESIQLQRGDFNRKVLSVRADDMRALAVLAETTPDELLHELRANDMLWEPTG